MNKQISTPVCIFIFLREDKSLSLINKIKQVSPPRVYIVGEGHRPDHPGEKEKVLAVRKAVEAAIDWDCKVETNYVPEDIGPGRRIASGVTWVFEKEESCIFLEDDVDPDVSFFYFCDELLKKYQDDKRIGMISGWKMPFNLDLGGCSYFFSSCGSIYGWASWRDRWQYYDWDMQALDSPSVVKRLVHRMGNKKAARRIKGWKRARAKIRQNTLSTWDYQWDLTRVANGFLDIIPAVSLTQNIGFDGNGTNSPSSVKCMSHRAKLFLLNPKKPICFPLKHPSYFLCNSEYDKFFIEKAFPLFIIKVFDLIEMICKMLFYKVF